MATHPQKARRWTSTAMFLVAAVVFLLTALLGDTGGDAAFVMLSMAFLVLALNEWGSARNGTDD